MAHRCDISGQGNQVGNRVSHAKNRRKHVFRANLQARRVYVPGESRFVKIKVSTRVIRTIDKLGLLGALKKHGLSLKDVTA